MKRLRRLVRASAGAFTGLLLLVADVRGDHIVSAQEGLGAGWWGLVLLGGVAIAFVGGIALTVFRIAREEERRELNPGRPGA